jgi:hypothetical protein
MRDHKSSMSLYFPPAFTATESAFITVGWHDNSLTIPEITNFCISESTKLSLSKADLLFFKNVVEELQVMVNDSFLRQFL